MVHYLLMAYGSPARMGIFRDLFEQACVALPTPQDRPILREIRFLEISFPAKVEGEVAAFLAQFCNTKGYFTPIDHALHDPIEEKLPIAMRAALGPMLKGKSLFDVMVPAPYEKLDIQPTGHPAQCPDFYIYPIARKKSEPYDVGQDGRPF